MKKSTLRYIDLVNEYNTVGKETQFYNGCIRTLDFGVHQHGKQKTPFIVIQTELNHPDRHNRNTALQSIRWIERGLGKDDDISLLTPPIIKDSKEDKFGCTTVYIVGDLPKAIVKLSAAFGEINGGILISRLQDVAEELGLPASSVRDLKFERVS